MFAAGEGTAALVMWRGPTASPWLTACVPPSPSSSLLQQCLNMLQGDTKPIRRVVEARFDEIKSITESRDPYLPVELSAWWVWPGRGARDWRIGAGGCGGIVPSPSFGVGCILIGCGRAAMLASAAALQRCGLFRMCLYGCAPHLQDPGGHVAVPGGDPGLPSLCAQAHRDAHAGGAWGRRQRRRGGGRAGSRRAAGGGGQRHQLTGMRG